MSINHKRSVREVEEVPCEALPGSNHLLVNTAPGQTWCGSCGKSWAALDAEINAGARKVAPAVDVAS